VAIERDAGGGEVENGKLKLEIKKGTEKVPTLAKPARIGHPKAFSKLRGGHPRQTSHRWRGIFYGWQTTSCEESLKNDSPVD
jgi:hypothetical protein